MILGIMVTEKEYLGMSDAERLKLLDGAYFRARQTKIRAKKYADRLDIIRHAPCETVLDRSQMSYVDALYAGLLD